MKNISNYIKTYAKNALFCAVIYSLSGITEAQTLPIPPETSAQKVKNQLIKACEANFSGSTNQTDDCLLCAKKASDINSRKFNNCMSSGADLYLPSNIDPLEELFPKKKK